MTADFVFKILIAGDGGVGKTTLMHRYVDDRFDIDTKMTIGVEIEKKTLCLDDYIKCDLQIWDFGGQERFRFLLDSFVMGAQGALMLFDLTRYKTLKNIDDWITIVRKFDPNLPIILIGAKADLEYKIAVEDEAAIQMGNKYQFIDYVKTSSKSGQNVGIAFEKLVRALVNKHGSEFLDTLKKKYDYFSGSLL